MSNTSTEMENPDSASAEDGEILRLRVEHERLREQVAALTEKLARQRANGRDRTGTGTPSKARSTGEASPAKDEPESGSAGPLIQRVESGIRSNPVAAMAVTFGVGFVLARMLRLGNRT